MASRFRLLDLNEDCVKTVLQCFDGFDLISFSLCSKKRLANVRSLKLHIDELSLYCGNTFYAKYDFGGNRTNLVFCENGYDSDIAESDIRPRRLQVDYIEGSYPLEQLNWVDENLDHENWGDENQEPVTRHWRKASFSGSDWLRHIMSVFNCDKIGFFSVMRSKFEIDSLMDTVRNLNIFETTILQAVSKEHTLRLLTALPCIDHLTVDSLTLNEPSEHSIFLRNQHNLTVRTQNKMTLDSVLSVNSFSLECSGLPIKSINRFIKLWKKGANPRLRHLCVSFFANLAVLNELVVLNENDVLRGVQHLRMPQEYLRLFEMPETRQAEVIGGFDIIGKTGRKATVTLENRALDSMFRMYIWQ